MPASLVSLSIRTGDGRPVVHTFRRQETPPRGLLICLPGQSYGVEGPLLYYPRRVLQERGWDTLGLTYGFQVRMSELSAETVAASLAEAKAAVEVVLRERAYPRLALVGKSLGASVLAWLGRELAAMGPAPAAFLTPLVGTPMFDAAFAESHGPAYVAIGTHDRFFDPAALDRLQGKRPFKLRVVDGQDHGLDFNGDLESSLRDVRTIVEDLVGFFDAPDEPGREAHAA